MARLLDGKAPSEARVCALAQQSARQDERRSAKSAHTISGAAKHDSIEDRIERRAPPPHEPPTTSPRARARGNVTTSECFVDGRVGTPARGGPLSQNRTCGPHIRLFGMPTLPGRPCSDVSGRLAGSVVRVIGHRLSDLSSPSNRADVPDAVVVLAPGSVEGNEAAPFEEFVREASIDGSSLAERPPVALRACISTRARAAGT